MPGIDLIIGTIDWHFKIVINQEVVILSKTNDRVLVVNNHEMCNW